MTIGPHLLGRKVDHDPRSRSFAAPTVPITTSVWWHRYGFVLDQGDVGACTAFAFAHWRNTRPAHLRGDRMMDADDGYDLYHTETVVQGGDVYPPDDPGGSGLAVCKAARQLGLIRSYSHAFGIDHARGVIGYSPVLVGSNWYGSMFNPDANGLVTIGGSVAGGHEYLCTGHSPRLGLWRFQNSWSALWGKKGSFYMYDDTFGRLLDEDGDITVPAL